MWDWSNKAMKFCASPPPLESSQTGDNFIILFDVLGYDKSHGRGKCALSLS